MTETKQVVKAGPVTRLLAPIHRATDTLLSRWMGLLRKETELAFSPQQRIRLNSAITTVNSDVFSKILEYLEPVAQRSVLTTSHALVVPMQQRMYIKDLELDNKDGWFSNAKTAARTIAFLARVMAPRVQRLVLSSSIDLNVIDFRDWVTLAHSLTDLRELVVEQNETKASDDHGFNDFIEITAGQPKMRILELHTAHYDFLPELAAVARHAAWTRLAVTQSMPLAAAEIFQNQRRFLIERLPKTLEEIELELVTSDPEFLMQLARNCPLLVAVRDVFDEYTDTSEFRPCEWASAFATPRPWKSVRAMNLTQEDVKSIANAELEELQCTTVESKSSWTECWSIVLERATRLRRLRIYGDNKPSFEQVRQSKCAATLVDFDTDAISPDVSMIEVHTALPRLEFVNTRRRTAVTRDESKQLAAILGDAKHKNALVRSEMDWPVKEFAQVALNSNRWRIVGGGNLTTPTRGADEKTMNWLAYSCPDLETLHLSPDVAITEQLLLGLTVHRAKPVALEIVLRPRPVAIGRMKMYAAINNDITLQTLKRIKMLNIPGVVLIHWTAEEAKDLFKHARKWYYPNFLSISVPATAVQSVPVPRRVEISEPWFLFDTYFAFVTITIDT